MAIIAHDVYDCFDSLFQDKHIIPDSLKLVWLKQAVSRYEKELSVALDFDDTLMEFGDDVDYYDMETLAWIMKELYQTREVSKANKTPRIVSKDISVDGADGVKKYLNSELEEIKKVVIDRINNCKSTAYNQAVIVWLLNGI